MLSSVSRDASSHAGAEPDDVLRVLRNVTELLRHTFSSQFVFPALGHTDLWAHRHGQQHRRHREHQARELYASVAAMWRLWLPNEALVTFEKGELAQGH